VHERLTRVGADERAEVSAFRAWQRDHRFDTEPDDQRDQDQPYLAADAAAARAPWRAEPERFAERRPAEGALLAPNEDGDEDELPDEAEGESDVQCLEERDVAGTGELVLEGGREKPGERLKGFKTMFTLRLGGTRG